MDKAPILLPLLPPAVLPIRVPPEKAKHQGHQGKTAVSWLVLCAERMSLDGKKGSATEIGKKQQSSVGHKAG